MSDRDLLQQALEALESRCGTHADERGPGGAITALRAALAQPEPEPVAWVDHNGELQSFADTGWVPLYLHPAPAIPEGWQLVPIESTKEMSDAFWSAYIPENKTAGAQASSFEDWWDFIHMYKAMLAAAPEYKQ